MFNMEKMEKEAKVFGIKYENVTEKENMYLLAISIKLLFISFVE